MLLEDICRYSADAGDTRGQPTIAIFTRDACTLAPGGGVACYVAPKRLPRGAIAHDDIVTRRSNGTTDPASFRQRLIVLSSAARAKTLSRAPGDEAISRRLRRYDACPRRCFAIRCAASLPAAPPPSAMPTALIAITAAARHCLPRC